MARNKVKISPTQWGVIFAVIAILILLIAFYLIGGPSTGFTFSQFIGIFVAAAISGVITVLLLGAQTDTLGKQREGEAQRDKDVKIYSNKIAAFSSFNKAVWQEDMDSTDPVQIVKTIKTIRKELYSKVILYLDSTEIDTIAGFIPTKDTENPYVQTVLSPIVDVLNKNAKRAFNSKVEEEEKGPKEEKTDPHYSESCKNLWDKINDWIHLYDDDLSDQDGLVEKSPAEIKQEGKQPTDQLPKTFNRQPWHFCMWSSEQLNRLDKNENELSLVEYGERWRTNLVRQVKPNDIVFLFRGSFRYSGVFKALGWRVFYYSTNENGVRVVSEEVSEGITPVFQGVVRAISEVKETLKKYDIYESFEAESSTSCANVVVEKLSYIRDGVVTQNGTYRKTISRYNRIYAARLLELFLKADPSCRETIEKSLPGFLKENNF